MNSGAGAPTHDSGIRGDAARVHRDLSCRPARNAAIARQPRSAAAPSRSTVRAPAPRLLTTGVMPSILVVDDCQPIAGILARHLRVEGHAVTVAYDGATARALVERAKPDCIFLDLMMPKMTGVELLHELKRDPGTAEIPIVLVSAHIGSGVTHVFSEHEANYSVGKPFTHEQVLAAVAAVLPHAARRAAPRPVVRAATHDPFIDSI